MIRKSLVLPALLGMLVPVLASCGMVGDSGGDGDAIVVGTTDKLELTEENPAPLDPATAYDINSWNILQNTFQTLMRMPRTGSEPEPDAAERCAFADRLSEQYRCTLRDGLTFTNGHDLTAEDVKFSVERMLKIKNPNGPFPLLANVDTVETPDELTVEKAQELLANPMGEERELGLDPQTHNPIVVRNGRFGPYVTEVLAEDDKAKPRTGSLFRSMTPETVTLEQALRLMALPRVVGTDEEGAEITAQNGRYGPYLKRGTDSRSLASEDQIFEITLDEARRIYAEPKRRGRAAAKPPLKMLGDNDVSGKPMSIKDGRFGPYVTDGVTNASLQRGDTPETMTDQRANELLSARRAREAEDGGASVKKSTKKTAKKSAKKTVKKAAKRPVKTTKRVVRATKK